MSTKISPQILKSPLRYPGGKSKALSFLIPYLPPIDSLDSYVEPMVGGGSMFLYFLSRYPHLKFWINDLNYDVFIFWKSLKDNPDYLINEVKSHLNFKNSVLEKHEKDYYLELKNQVVERLDYAKRAALWFVLNRISFSGTTHSGGFSKDAFYSRFNHKSLYRLIQVSEIFKKCDLTITCNDVTQIEPLSNKSFYFLDPPYCSAKKSKLYGVKGDLHSNFSHFTLSKFVHPLTNPVMMTYDNSIDIKKLYPSPPFRLIEWNLGYSMTSVGKNHCTQGNELLILNYQPQT